MKSDDLTVQQLFQDRRQYMVPFYQRSYVWNLSNQWSELWLDVQAKAEARLLGNKRTPHFLGAIVLDPQPREGLIGVDTLHIIDGQQRLTTLQFMLKAALLTLHEIGHKPIADIVKSALSNSNPDTMRDQAVEEFKVWPTFRDRKDYCLAFGVENRDELIRIFPESFTQRATLRKVGLHHPPPLEAVWFFSEEFGKWIRGDGDELTATRAEALISAILQDLKVVSIVLDSNDDAQVIFETLNGRGAQLHSTDLIRNFIFMRADKEGADSERLYRDLWSGFETDYWSTPQRRGRMLKPRLEWFIHSFLQAVMAEEVDLGRLYFEYRRYVFAPQEAEQASNQLASLSHYSRLYQEMVDGRGDTPLAIFGRRITPHEVTTIYPLALMIGASGSSVGEQHEMFDLLVSYVVRRSLCGLTQKNYNNVFISILKTLSRSDISPQRLRSVLIEQKGDASRWPRDEELMRVCRTHSLYPGRLEVGKLRAVLSELELELRGSARTEDFTWANFGHLDIDHILPKSWCAHWPLPSGELIKNEELDETSLKELLGMELSDREQAIITREGMLKTLGNLTLLNLSVNRAAQNKAFKIKKKLLLENTNLRLNIPLLGLEEWNEETITKRGELLTAAALKIWPGIRADSPES